MPDFAGKQVLDLGCGYGWHCVYAAERGASHVTGVDLSEKMLDTAREKTHFPQVEYLHAAIEDVDFPPESFDVVFSSLTIHYLQDFPAFVERVRSWLKPGGDFVFSVEQPPSSPLTAVRTGITMKPETSSTSRGQLFFTRESGRRSFLERMW